MILNKAIPQTLRGRILLSLLITLLVTVSGIYFLQEVETRAVRDVAIQRSNARISGALARVILETQNPEEQKLLLERMQEALPFFKAQWTTGEVFYRQEKDLDRIKESMPLGFKVGTALDMPVTEDRPTDVVLSAPDGTSLKVSMLLGSLTFSSASSLIFPAISLVVLLAGLSCMSRALSKQLALLASAAASISLGSYPKPLPVTGPMEVQQLALTINEMRDRISTLLERRSLAAMAVGHDLRLPITRLLLRGEAVEDKDLHDAIIRDVRHINDVAGELLTVLGDEDTVVPERTDVASILIAVCSDYADLGTNVTYAGPDKFVMDTRPDHVIRIVSNLVSNASQHAEHIVVTLAALPTSEDLHIWVDDDGPGLSQELYEKAVTPLWTTNAADGHAHFGLGLYIADTLSKDLGGSVTLGVSPAGGLRVHVRLSNSFR